MERPARQVTSCFYLLYGTYKQTFSGLQKLPRQKSQTACHVTGKPQTEKVLLCPENFPVLECRLTKFNKAVVYIVLSFDHGSVRQCCVYVLRLRVMILKQIWRDTSFSACGLIPSDTLAPTAFISNKVWRRRSSTLEIWLRIYSNQVGM